ncbi:MAG: UvrB/UvrC motif-containing protein [Phycisphaerales bacterium]
MRCDICGNEATHHEIIITGGQHRARNLCDQCARKQGALGAVLPGSQAGLPTLKALEQAMATALSSAADAEGGAEGTHPTNPGPAGPAPGGEKAKAPTPTCPSCGLLFRQFRETGRLGCEGCYEAFAAQLAPLIARAHEGATHHAGRGPARQGAGQPAAPAPPSAPPAELLRRANELRAQLEAAIACEQYERAASLRDQLRRFGGASDVPPAPGREPGQ